MKALCRWNKSIMYKRQMISQTCGNQVKSRRLRVTYKYYKQTNVECHFRFKQLRSNIFAIDFSYSHSRDRFHTCHQRCCNHPWNHASVHARQNPRMWVFFSTGATKKWIRWLDYKRVWRKHRVWREGGETLHWHIAKRKPWCSDGC